MVDPEDYEPMSQFNWCAVWNPSSKTFFAVRRGHQSDGERNLHTILMHREILNAPEGIDVDHRDGNDLNNRRKNLRLATRSQNICNQKAHEDSTSGFKGVSRKRSRWRARIFVEGKEKGLGIFDTPEAASAAYIEAAKKFHGEFANW